MMMMMKMTKMTNRHLWLRERDVAVLKRRTHYNSSSLPLFLFKHFSNKNRNLIQFPPQKRKG